LNPSSYYKLGGDTHETRHRHLHVPNLANTRNFIISCRELFYPYSSIFSLSLSFILSCFFLFICLSPWTPWTCGSWCQAPRAATRQLPMACTIAASGTMGYCACGCHTGTYLDLCISQYM